MMKKLSRSNSTINSRSKSSLTSLSDIVHEEDEILHSDKDLQNWTILKPDKKRGLQNLLGSVCIPG